MSIFRYDAKLLAAVLLLAASPAAGQTLEQALALTYRSNPQLLTERARLRATDEGLPQALSNWRPTVSINNSAGYNSRDTFVDARSRSSSARSPEPDTLNQWSAAVTVAQPLYRGGRTTAETNRAENLVQRGRALLLGVEQSVFLDTVTAYANLLRDQAVLELTTNNVQVLQKQLDAVQDRFRVGEVTRTDVAQAEARLERAKSDRIQAEGNLTSTRANYLRVVGEVPGKLAAAPLPRNLPGSEREAIAGAPDNPNVVAARYNELASQNDVDLIAGELLPSVSLNTTASKAYEQASPNTALAQVGVTLNLTIPLYQAGSVEARTRAAKQTVGQRRMEFEDVRRRALEDSARFYEAYTTAKSQIGSFNSQIRASSIALEGVEQEARVGTRTVLDVLNAEQELLDGRVNLVRAQRDNIVAAYQLVGAIGKLTAKDLSLPVDVYDPATNYNFTRNRWTGTKILDEDLIAKPK
ncbi:MAG: TolC family outer membrane protein [Proteobacteria bacterium]|nr:TolC family outer membrane protein [Pseudomonadota bacterium]